MYQLNPAVALKSRDNHVMPPEHMKWANFCHFLKEYRTIWHWKHLLILFARHPFPSAVRAVEWNFHFLTSFVQLMFKPSMMNMKKIVFDSDLSVFKDVKHDWLCSRGNRSTGWITIHLHTMYVSLLNIALGILNHSHAYIPYPSLSLFPLHFLSLFTSFTPVIMVKKDDLNRAF